MTRWRRQIAAGCLIAAATISWIGAASAQTLRIGLAEDPDILDPTLARTYVGRIVFAALCDKLVDIGPELEIVPQLATEWQWTDGNKGLVLKLRPGIKFQDGEPFDAAAVKFNIERHLSMPGSNRKAEIGAVTGAEVIDDHTVKLALSAPYAPLLAQLTDRAGMMVSPKAAQAAGEHFGSHPVCAGPFKFVERVAQDRIVLERFADYWDNDNIKLDRIVYLPIPDPTVRLANLRSGGLDLMERVAATDLDTVRKDARLKLSTITGLGYTGITINLAKANDRRRRWARMRGFARRSSCRSIVMRSTKSCSVASSSQAINGSHPPIHITSKSCLSRGVTSPRPRLCSLKQLRPTRSSS